MTIRARLLCSLSLVAAAGCAEPLPPPRPVGEEPVEALDGDADPAPAPTRTPSREPLVVKPSEAGPLVRHPDSGLTFVAPGDGRVLGPGRRGDLAFDAGYRLDEHPFEVRLRTTRVNRPGEARKVALRLCRGVAAARSKLRDVRVDAGLGTQCRDWGADAAASAVYPCKQGDLDMEETLVLVKGNRALVVWKAFARRQVPPALWSELNTRLNGSLRWGGRPRVLKATTSFYVDGRARLTKGAEAHAEKLAATLEKAGVKRADALRAADKVREVAFGSDAPDAALGDRAIVREAIEAGLPAALKRALATEFKERVVTHRDLRGLDPFLRALAKRLK